MHTEPFKNDMANEVDTLIKNAFTNSEHGYGNEAELVTDLRNSETITFELVAFDQDKIVGHALASEATINTVKGLVLAPLSVLTTKQKQGIGTMLMEAVENIAKDNDYKFISILGDPAYYNRFGYKPSKLYNVLAPMNVPDEVFMLKVFYKNINYTGTLKYAPEFGI